LDIAVGGHSSGVVVEGDTLDVALGLAAERLQARSRCAASIWAAVSVARVVGVSRREPRLSLLPPQDASRAAAATAVRVCSVFIEESPG
jgi:hypothetical protein